MVNRTQYALLRALLLFAKNDRSPCIVTLAAAVGLSCNAVDRTICELDSLGLVDADRLRLSMHGLALAAGLAPKQRKSQARSAA